MQDLNYEFINIKNFKKRQLDVLVKDIENLLDHKTEFNKKTDFLFDKLMEISGDVHTKMQKMVREFDAIKNPILNKV